jgi:hypothetical protein
VRGTLTFLVPRVACAFAPVLVLFIPCPLTAVTHNGPDFGPGSSGLLIDAIKDALPHGCVALLKLAQGQGQSLSRVVPHLVNESALCLLVCADVHTPLQDDVLCTGDVMALDPMHLS